MLQDSAGLFHFGDANEESVVDVADVSDGDIEIEILVAGIGLMFSQVECDAGCAGDGAGATEGEGFGSGENADILGSFFPDGVIDKESFDDFEFFGEFFEEFA